MVQCRLTFISRLTSSIFLTDSARAAAAAASCQPAKSILHPVVRRYPIEIVLTDLVKTFPDFKWRKKVSKKFKPANRTFNLVIALASQHDALWWNLVVVAVVRSRDEGRVRLIRLHFDSSLMGNGGERKSVSRRVVGSVGFNTGEQEQQLLSIWVCVGFQGGILEIRFRFGFTLAFPPALQWRYTWFAGG